MDGCVATVNRQTIHTVLSQLLRMYNAEIVATEQLYRESQQYTIKPYTREAKAADLLYWESAQDTVLDVAAALDIPLQEVQRNETA